LRTCRSRKGRPASPTRRDGAWASMMSELSRTGAGRARGPRPPEPAGVAVDRMGLFSVPFRPADGPLVGRMLKPYRVDATRSAGTSRTPAHGLPGMPAAGRASCAGTELVLLDDHGVLRPVIVQEARPPRHAFCRSWPRPKRRRRAQPGKRRAGGLRFLGRASPSGRSGSGCMPRCTTSPLGGDGGDVPRHVPAPDRL
jgi:hypothetical protein